jgi:hypothetical protein
MPVGSPHFGYKSEARILDQVLWPCGRGWIKGWRCGWRWQTGHMVFVADDLGAWLVGVLADAGSKKLLALVLGTDEERALRAAAAAAVQLTAAEFYPNEPEQAEKLAMVISHVFAEPLPGVSLAEHETVHESIRDGVARQLAVLDDAALTGTGQSSAAVLGVSGATLAEKLTSRLMHEIVDRAARGTPLGALASQLNHDLTHMGLKQLVSSVESVPQNIARQIAEELENGTA